MKINYCKNCEAENPITNKYCSKCGFELPKIESETTTKSKTIQKENTTAKKKKAIGIIVGIIAFGLTFYGTQKFLLTPASFDKSLMEVVNEINKTCPITIDAETRLDNSIALPGKVLQYNYTLVNFVKDSVNIKEAKNMLEPNIINSIKNNPQMKTLKDYKTTFNYYYKDKNGQFLFIISVEPDKYK